jgi:hypothetical protein
LNFSSLDDFGALLVKKLVTAIGAEKLNLLMPELLPVTIEFTVAAGTGHPENLRHFAMPPEVRPSAACQ